MPPGSLRIVGGSAKRRHLKVPGGRRVRPTSDRVKESIFDILQDLLKGGSVLDLFAGSGNLGIEALSRGASEAVFVDRERECIRTIEENLEGLGLRGRGRTMRMDSLSAIRRLKAKGWRFSVIFLDPPYGKGWGETCLRALGDAHILQDGGWIVVEHTFREEVPRHAEGLFLCDQRAYGETRVSFYRRDEGSLDACRADKTVKDPRPTPMA